MGANTFSTMATDAIGEILNISLGSSATAVSNMLARRVDISTPRVEVVTAEEFTLGDLQPAVGVRINYVAGLTGTNIMLLKRSDVRMIVDILMGTETADEDFEMNELNVSAVCEVMNQMMGASATALSDFLGRMVNISTPESFEIKSLVAFKEENFPTSGMVVVVRFDLIVEDAMNSEFMFVMSVELANELIAGFGLEPENIDGSLPPKSSAAQPQADTSGAADSAKTLSQAEIEQMMQAQQAASPQPAPMQQQPHMQQPPMQQQQPMQPPMPQAPYGGAEGGYPPPYPQAPAGGYPPYPPYPYPPYPAYPEPKVIDTKAPSMPQLRSETTLNTEQSKNLDLILSVPLDVSVEIGRTRRKVREILGYTKGSLIVLDRLAGDQVDLFVNGKCIAKGDVVVIDDNFGIRITEIIQRLEAEDLQP